MKKSILFISILSIFSIASQLGAHCQIPCGIFDDDKEFASMLEDVTTIRKSINEIAKLEKEESPNYNQLVRWVSNKEEHADLIGQSVFKYFLQQKIKEGQDHYEEKLVALHKIAVLAMKAKQSADPNIADDLEESIKAFHGLYHHHH